jgi:hypothetical protein
MANVVVSALATWNGKALKKGKQELSAFDQSVKKLGKTFATVFGTAALLNYSKKAINAFAADEKAAKALEQQLKNTGYAFSAPAVEMYIANLQKATGVLDDQLRPAFQSILTVTGSITKSQEALNTALNVSAATGKSLTEVSQALAKGYAGQTTALSRLGAGLSKATLKSGDMNKILEELNTKFAGQAAARLDTYAGKMDQLRVASANAAETIGKSLLDAISSLSKGGTISSLGTQIEDVANSVSYLITGIAELGVELKKLTKINVPTPGGGGWLDFFLRNAPVVSAYYNAGKSKQAMSQPAKETPAMGRIAAQQRKLEVAALKNSVALRKAEVTQLKKKSAVDKLSDKFDLERIGLAKALKETTDAEIKLRLEAKIAILDNNEALAEKILAEMEAAKKAKELADEFGKATDAFAANTAQMQKLLFELVAKLNLRTEAGTFNPTGFSAPGLKQLFPPAMGPLGNIDYTVPMGSGNPVYSPGSSGTPMSYADVRLTIDVAQSGDQFAQLIADSVQVAQRSGYSTTSAGSLNP